MVIKLQFVYTLFFFLFLKIMHTYMCTSLLLITNMQMHAVNNAYTNA